MACKCLFSPIQQTCSQLDWAVRENRGGLLSCQLETGHLAGFAGVLIGQAEEFPPPLPPPLLLHDLIEWSLPVLD